MVNDCKSVDSNACICNVLNPDNELVVNAANCELVKSPICTVVRFDKADVESDLTCVVDNACKSTDSNARRFVDVNPFNCADVNDATCNVDSA